MSGIELCPQKGGKAVAIPKEKTTIGRGPFLEVTDKRVSRNHANLEVIDGKLILTPIHTNPCFYIRGGTGQTSTLEKDKAMKLLHNDVIGLLPDKYFFKVTYKDQEEEKEEAVDTTVKKKIQAVANGEDEDKEEEEEEEEEEEVKPKPVPTGIVKRGHKEMALPIQKQRLLPPWMKGAAKRVSLQTSPKKTQKSPAKARPVASNAKAPQKRPQKAAKYEDDYEDDDDDDEDYEEVKPKKKKGRAPPRRRRRSDSDDDDDYEEGKKPVRRPRAASLKKPKYKDDFVVSGDELGLSSLSDEDDKKKDEDSDFSLDDSDWDKPSKKSKARGNTPRGKGKGTKRSARKSKYSSDEEESDDDLSESDEETYVPRPSKRRGGGGGGKRRRKDSESDEWEEEPKRSKTKRTPAKRKKVSSSENEEEKDEEEDRGEKKPKSDERDKCRYGESCYRKNPQHFEEFCHPGDSSWDSDQDEKPKAKTKARPQRKAARPKDKKSTLHGASDDDGMANTYDYDDSFMDNKEVSDSEEESSYGNESDSDWEPDMGSDEDVRGLVREAKGFVRNKKMSRPARYK